MQPRLLVLGGDAALDAVERERFDAAVGSTAAGASRFASAAALLESAMPQPSVPTLVVVAPDVADPLGEARQVARALVDARFVFVGRAADEAAFRRRAAYAAPPGGRWSHASIDDPRLAERIGIEFRAALQQRRLRTTLERMRGSARPAPLPDPGEYRRLVASDRYLASVLRHAHDAIVSLDPAGGVVSWNTGAELLFSRTMEQARRAPFTALFRDPDAAAAGVAAALAGSHRMAALEVERDGALRYVDANFGALRDDGAETIGVVAILRDVTERHRVEEELRASARQKDEFLAMLAHELRNPLAPIRSAAQILAMIGHHDARAVRAVDVIARQADHMGGLIDDLLDVARVTRGAVVLEREVLVLVDVVRDAVDQARGLIEARGHTLELDTGEGTVQVLGDRKRLTQVVANLLVNAAKYTPPDGRIRLSIGHGPREARLVVEDSGIGMTPELRARVFDLFVQGNRAPDRAEGGLGVGLSLVRSLVGLHGGSVSAASDGPGRGSRFEVRLPCLVAVPERAQAATRTPVALPVARRSLRVMVVDDNEDAARTLAVLLQAHGHRVHVEIDPRLGVSRALRERPDALVLDIGMPHIDGYEFARRMQELPPSRRPQLIALTGYGHPADRERAREAGFDHHMVKPPDVVELLEMLDRAPGTAA